MKKIKKIKKLAEKAGFNYIGGINDNLYDVSTTENLEEFAELLLKDTIKLVEKWGYDSRNDIAYMLAEHYGFKVEE